MEQTKNPLTILMEDFAGDISSPEDQNDNSFGAAQEELDNLSDNHDNNAEQINEESVAIEPSEDIVIPDDEAGEITDPNDVPDEYGSSFNDRLNQTPINNGEWSGERGNSTWKPEIDDVAEQLSQHGVDGIDYRDGFPDFSPVSSYEYQLPEDLYESGDPAQFNACNEALANHLENNPEFASNFDEDQLEAISAGKKPSGYTWHHDVKQGNMQLVPTRIHQNCGHYGGKNIWGGGTTNRKYLEE